MYMKIMYLKVLNEIRVSKLLFFLYFFFKIFGFIGVFSLQNFAGIVFFITLQKVYIVTLLS